MAKNLLKDVKKQREATAPKKLSEYSIIEIVEKICNPDRLEGEWIAKQDIVEDGTKLKLVEQEAVGECGTECRTIARACEEVIGDSDTDVAEALFRESTKRAQLSKLLCYELSGACKRKPPPVPKDRPAGEEFQPKDSKDLEVERLMQEMQGMGGMGGGMEMFKRDEMMKKMGMGAGDDDDEDDDEDEDFTSPMKEHFAEDDAKNGLKFDKKSAEDAKSAPKDAASGSTLADLTDSAKEVFDTASSKAKEALDSAVEVGKSAADALTKQAHQAAEVIGEKAGQVGEYISDWVSSLQGKKDEAKSAEL
ncbi:hypothetical protein KFL_001520060 [Klebsormidium nitens]|uniref:DUF3456 domain-containing protein n=1 Tax=Klebsormidium nitens TaxID=105231 RepID=A0A1Y1I477_KLENI|nr:hypothetical protein KFL_001520060 [Klebsormidium nitens]|eukprot:GAQ83536.1 hypothetical protein KFL_001520060 [Klebsormidium nitens]